MRLAILVVLAAGPARLFAQTPDWTSFDRYVSQAAKDWRVPGMAIAIVKNDSVVFAKGYGVIEAGKTQPFDVHTRFPVASTTKAMTSAALAMLVDEGKLRWDDRVVTYIPELQLSDPWVTRELTIRDLLTHRSGLAGTDLLWNQGWKSSRAEIIHALRYVEPTTSFRSQWQYQNVVYSLGGTVIERITGMSWDAFIRARVFAALGMNESEPLTAGVSGKPNVTSPHVLRNDSVRVTPFLATDLTAPAGAAWSTASDMSKWLRFILDSGRVGEKRLISAATFREMITPQISVPQSFYAPLAIVRPNFFSYGLGWFIQDYRGEQMWMHTGSLPGLSTIVGLWPNQRLAVVVIENLDHAELRHALMYAAFDAYNGRTRDWSAAIRDLVAPRVSTASSSPVSVQIVSPSSLPLDRYAGTYVDSAYGTVRITHSAGALTAAIVSAIPVPLKHSSFDQFTTPSLENVVFIPDGAGGVNGVRYLGITFRRTPSR